MKNKILVGKNILIIGSGFGQLPAIFKAKEMGANVYSVDKNPKAPGAQICDFFFKISVNDSEKVLQIVKKYNIDFAFTMQSDHGIKTVAIVNNFLSVNNFPIECALACYDKSVSRNKLKKKNCNQPNFSIVTSLEECIKSCETIGYPIMIKCPDSSGSRGITKVINKNKVKSAYLEALKWTKSKNILVEEYIDGIEFGAQTFSLNGKCEIVLLHNDQISEKPHMIPIGHSFPFIHEKIDNTDIIINDIKNAVNAMGIINGPANVDVKYDLTNQKLYVIEISARIGATCLPELIEFHTGVDWTEISLICPFVKLKKSDLIKFKQNVAAKILFSKKSGRLKSISIENPSLIDELTKFSIDCTIGDNVNALSKGTDRIGSILIMDDNFKRMNYKLEKISKSIKFKVE